MEGKRGKIKKERKKTEGSPTSKLACPRGCRKMGLPDN